MSQELSRRVGVALAARGETLALAESCTGGLIAKLVTDIAGSSAWFERGLVTYSNAAKQSLLGVSDEILQRHGAVSAPCAWAMAEGLLRSSPAHWGIAVTGVAGPGGGTPEKPVGLVWLALIRRGGTARTRELRLGGSREQIREQSAAAALQWLLDELK